MSAVVWIIIVTLILAACCGGKARKGKPSGARSRPTRVEHPHYMEADDYECSVCGARFRKKSMVCPSCGTRFDGTEVDEAEFEEEMMEEDDWDEED